MKVNGLGGYSSVNAFVEGKLAALAQSDRSFHALFSLMFREEENVMFESNDGYRIRKTTYGQVKAEILSLSGRLYGALASLPHGEKVGLCLPNGPFFIACYWALLRAGYQPLLVNTRLERGLLHRTLKEAGVTVLIAEGEEDGFRTLTEETLAALPEAALGEDRWADGVWLMSSGTSEKVKLCLYTGERFYHQLSDSARIIRECKAMRTHYDGELKLLCFLPFYHIFGLAAVYTWFAFFSRTFVLLPSLAPSAILGTIRRHHVTHIFAVPLLWNRIYEGAMAKIRESGQAEKAEKGLALWDRAKGNPLLRGILHKKFAPIRAQLFGESISFCISGGGPVRPCVLRFFNAIGYPLANGYGMTEVGITSVELSPRADVRNLGAIGEPFASVIYRLEADGELAVKSPAMAARILCGKTEVPLPADGFFRTGDLAYKENGRFFLSGRRDDLLVGQSGENINPDRAQAGMEIPGAVDFCLCRAGNGAALVVQLPSAAVPEEAAQVRERAMQALRGQNLSGEVGQIVLTAAPLMEEGDFKISRRRLQARLESGSLPPFAPAESGDASQLCLEICALFAEVLGREKVQPEDDFFAALGGDSLAFLVLLQKIREKYGADVSALGCFTPTALAKALEGQS